MEFRILGRLQVLDDGMSIDLGPHKQRALLALLLLRANRVVATERILEELWGDEATGKENALWVYISRLRSALEPGRVERGQSSVLLTRDHGYVLEIDETSIDAHRFETAAGQGRALLRDDPQAASRLLRDALACWRGSALEDFAYDDFARAEAARLEELRLNALEDRIEADLRTGKADELVAELEQLRAAEPLRERPVAQSMLALYRSGRHAEALRVFGRFRRYLSEELGVDPSPELRRLEERVLLHDDELRPNDRDSAGVDRPTAVDELPVGHNPYKGLHPFREGDAADFFGRDRLISQIVGRLARHDRLLALVGPSGSGKSSVVRGGVLPALRRGAVPGSERWVIALMVPGSHPFAELEAALLRAAVDAPSSFDNALWDEEDGLLRASLRLLPDGARLLLVVDQFEELFTLVERDDVRQRFIANLLRAMDDGRGRVQVVLTLRADAYHRPLEHAELGTRLNDSVLNVVPLLPDELEAAAQGPAARAGVSLDSPLLAELLTDVVGEPGTLPIFQYALTELFERRVGDRMTLTTYRSMGGVRGALSRRAEEVFADLDETQQAAARQLFLRLVTIAEHDEWSRRRVFASELLLLELDPVVLQAVIAEYERHRFLAFDRDQASGAPTVEVAHEALLREWPRLREWIEAGRADLRRRASLRAAMAEWREAGCDDDYLLTGTRLGEYERWSTTTEMAMTSDELAFLAASVRRRDEDTVRASSLVAAGEHLRRRARRQRWGLVAAVGLLGLATVPPLVIDEPPRPVVALFILGAGGSIDDLVHDAAEAARQRFDVDVVEVAPPLTGPVATLRQLADDGADVVITLGPEAAFEAAPIASEYPDIRWGSIEPPPIEFGAAPVTYFAEAEGSFLAGAAAATTSRSGTIGFVGGFQNEQIEAFRAGYEAGARAANPEVDIVSTYVSAGPGIGVGFGRDDLAEVAARQLYDQGVDVIYHAAGAAGRGVFEAAQAASRADGTQHWAIGVDSDQYLEVDDRLKPYVLTSMVKRYDLAILGLIGDLIDDRPRPARTLLGVADDAMGLASSGDHLDAATRGIVADFQADLAAGRRTAPIAPTGALDPPPGVASMIDATVTLDGQGCAYDGPLTVSGGDALRVEFRNSTTSDAYGALFVPDVGAPAVIVPAVAHGSNVGYVVVDGVTPELAVECVPNMTVPNSVLEGPVVEVAPA